MRVWTYTWKSSDGLRHEGEMGAPSKDDVYAELRKRGIRAIKVTERIAPVIRKGFRGLRKRDIWCLVVIGAVLVAVTLLLTLHGPFGAEVRSASVTSAEDVERIAPDPASREALLRLVEERKAKEEECRAALVKRVEEGTLAKETANGIFRAMGLEELK